MALSQLRICRPPLFFRSSHLDIENAHWAENKDRRKVSYHIKSRLGATGVQKVYFGRPNILLSSTGAQFCRVDRIDLALIFTFSSLPISYLKRATSEGGGERGVEFCISLAGKQPIYIYLNILYIYICECEYY